MRSDGVRVDMSSVVKALFAPGSKLDGKPVEKAKVVVLVKDILKS